MTLYQRRVPCPSCGSTLTIQQDIDWHLKVSGLELVYV